jgi:hypothetical protein
LYALLLFILRRFTVSQLPRNAAANQRFLGVQLTILGGGSVACGGEMPCYTMGVHVETFAGLGCRPYCIQWRSNEDDGTVSASDARGAGLVLADGGRTVHGSDCRERDPAYESHKTVDVLYQRDESVKPGLHTQGWGGRFKSWRRDQLTAR